MYLAFPHIPCISTYTLHFHIYVAFPCVPCISTYTLHFCNDLYFHFAPKFLTLTYISVFQLALGADTLHQVEEKFTGHGLDAAREGFIVDVLGEQTDRHRQFLKGQGLPHMVDQVR